VRPRVLFALFASLLLLASPAVADEPPPAEDLPPIEEYEPTFTEAPAYLHAHTLPIGNLDAVQGNFVRWDETAPEGEQSAVYIGNNYGGILDDSTGEGGHNPAHFLTMEGTALGDLDNIAFDLYFSGWAQATIGCPIDLSLQLVIDDVVIVDQTYTGSTGFNNQQVDDDTFRTKFVLTNLWKATEEFELAYGPEVEHKVYLNVQNFYLCNEVIWEYDSAETPAGLVVNMPEPGASYFKFDVLDPPPPLEA
jgi:hypothetical protein